MANFTSFGSLATTYLSGISAPKSIEFSQSNALQTSIEGLANAAAVEYDLTPDKSIREHVADYEKMAKDRLANDVMLKPFSDMADAFAQKLYTGITNLKKVRRDVSTLMSSIDKHYKKLLSEDPVIAAYTGETKAKLSMRAVNWNKLSNISERATIAQVHDRIGADDTAEVTSSILNMAISKLPGVTDERKATPVSDLNKSKVERIIDGVHATVKGRCTRNEVSNVVKSALYLTNYHLKEAAGAISLFADGSRADQINRYMDQARLGNIILPRITDEVTDVSAANRKRINNNIDLINEINQMVAYVAFHYRNTVWHDSIMVPGPMINPDTAEQFQEQGGTIDGLVHYFNYAYKDTGVPANGIGVKFAVDSLKNVEEEYKTEAAKQASVCEDKRKQFLRDSFIYKGIEYLENHRKSLSKQFAVSNLPEYVAATYDAVLQDAPMESRLYNMILNSCFINSIESNIYHRLNKSYMKHASTTPTLTDKMCDHIDVSVYSDMIAEYLVDKGILIAQ